MMRKDLQPIEGLCLELSSELIQVFLDDNIEGFSTKFSKYLNKKNLCIGVLECLSYQPFAGDFISLEHVAAYYDAVSILLFLKQQSCVSLNSQFGYSAIDYAVVNNSIGAIGLFKTPQPNLNKKMEVNPIYIAAKVGNPKVISILYNMGYQAKYQRNSSSPLQVAIKQRNKELARQLIQRDPDLVSKDYSIGHILMNCLSHGMEDFVEEILPLICANNVIMDVFHVACLQRKTSLIKKMIAYKFPQSTPSYHPIYDIIFTDDPELVNFFLDAIFVNASTYDVFERTIKAGCHNLEEIFDAFLRHEIYPSQASVNSNFKVVNGMLYNTTLSSSIFRRIIDNGGTYDKETEAIAKAVGNNGFLAAIHVDKVPKFRFDDDSDNIDDLVDRPPKTPKQEPAPTPKSEPEPEPEEEPELHFEEEEEEDILDW